MMNSLNLPFLTYSIAGESTVNLNCCVEGSLTLILYTYGGVLNYLEYVLSYCLGVKVRSLTGELLEVTLFVLFLGDISALRNFFSLD